MIDSYLVVGLLALGEGDSGATGCTTALTKDAPKNDDADNQRHRKK